MTIPIRKVLPYLLVPVLFLLLMDFFPESISWTIHQRFDLNQELNVPTWYSATLLLLVSVAALGLFAYSDPKSPSRRFWLITSLVYCYLSIDESAALHEALAVHIKWYYVYAPPAFAYMLFTLRTLFKHEEATVRNWILVGLVAYGTGALTLEIIWYIFKPFPAWAEITFVAVEETLEMVGTILVLGGCLHAWNRLMLSRLSARTEVERQPAR